MIDAFSRLGLDGSDSLAVGVDVTLKASALLVLALMIHRALGRRPARFALAVGAVVGYQPFESRTIRSDERSVELEVKLTKAAADTSNTLKGTVRRPGGKPLAEAEVVLTYSIGGRSRLPSVRIEDGTLQPGQDQEIVRTDSAGRFSLAREPDPEGRYYAVVVVHPDFYAEVERAAFEKDSTITAKPWGRVEGMVRINTRPARGVEVRYFSDRLGNPDVPYLHDSGKTTADAHGRFVLDRVVPGDVRIAREYGDPASPTGHRGWSNGTLIEARAGATVRAEVGGKGRPVIARVSLPEGFEPKADDSLHYGFEIKSDRPHIPPAKGADLAKPWWASAEGHEYRRNYFMFLQARLEPDGTLHADDVPPGDYLLRLTYNAGPIDGRGRSRQSASVTTTFTIPAIPGGSTEEPLDLGVLKPEVVKDARGQGILP